MFIVFLITLVTSIFAETPWSHNLYSKYYANGYDYKYSTILDLNSKSGLLSNKYVYNEETFREFKYNLDLRLKDFKAENNKFLEDIPQKKLVLKEQNKKLEENLEEIKSLISTNTSIDSYSPPVEYKKVAKLSPRILPIKPDEGTAKEDIRAADLHFGKDSTYLERKIRQESYKQDFEYKKIALKIEENGNYFAFDNIDDFKIYANVSKTYNKLADKIHNNKEFSSKYKFSDKEEVVKALHDNAVKMRLAAVTGFFKGFSLQVLETTTDGVIFVAKSAYNLTVHPVDSINNIIKVIDTFDSDLIYKGIKKHFSDTWEEYQSGDLEKKGEILGRLSAGIVEVFVGGIGVKTLVKAGKLTKFSKNLSKLSNSLKMSPDEVLDVFSTLKNNRFSPLRSVDIVNSARKFGLKTAKGTKVYAKLHKPLETLPNGLKVKRIREGADSTKIAVIGR